MVLCYSYVFPIFLLIHLHCFCKRNLFDYQHHPNKKKVTLPLSNLPYPVRENGSIARCLIKHWENFTLLHLIALSFLTLSEGPIPATSL
jgi:hypothetical protein